jgi:hypothetical protein
MTENLEGNFGGKGGEEVDADKVADGGGEIGKLRKTTLC